MRREKVVCFMNHAAETGGAEFALARLIACMDRTCWHPVVVFGEEGPAVELLRSRSVETYVLQMPKSIGKLRRESLNSLGWRRIQQAAGALKYVSRLHRFLRERAVEIVHTNSMKAHVLGGIAARMAGIPLVWHLRDSFHPDCLPPLALGLMHLLVKHLPDRVLVVSESVARDAFAENLRHRARVVYDGLEPSFFQNEVTFPLDKPAQDPFTIHSSECLNPKWKVGIVGRLCAWKGQHLFLEAASKLIGRGIDVQFEVIGGPLFGEDAYANQLYDFADSNALREHVHFAGFVHDVASRIRSWDVLVHASTAPDPCPNVVLEAMAAGVPVVGSRGGGVPELLANGECGVLFPMNDAEALSHAVESLLRDTPRRRDLSVAARIRALRHFQADRVAREVESEWAAIADERIYANRKWSWIEDGSPVPRIPRNQPSHKLEPESLGSSVPDSVAEPRRHSSAAAK